MPHFSWSSLIKGTTRSLFSFDKGKGYSGKGKSGKGQKGGKKGGEEHRGRSRSPRRPVRGQPGRSLLREALFSGCARGRGGRRPWSRSQEKNSLAGRIPHGRGMPLGPALLHGSSVSSSSSSSCSFSSSFSSGSSSSFSSFGTFFSSLAFGVGGRKACSPWDSALASAPAVLPPKFSRCYRQSLRSRRCNALAPRPSLFADIAFCFSAPRALRFLFCPPSLPHSGRGVTELVVVVVVVVVVLVEVGEVELVENEIDEVYEDLELVSASAPGPRG